MMWGSYRYAGAYNHTPQRPAEPQAEGFYWPRSVYDHRDRFVIGNTLSKRGWMEQKFSWKLFASNKDNMAQAERDLADALWPDACLPFWSASELYVELRFLKAPGKTQQDPEWWKEHQDAPSMFHYAVQGFLYGLLPIPGNPDIAVYPNIDWKKWKEDSAKAKEEQHLYYAERPLPPVKGWRVRHTTSKTEDGDSAQSSGGAKHYASEAVGTVKATHIEANPLVRNYIGVVKATDPLGTIIADALDKLCAELKATACLVTSSAKITRTRQRFVAKKTIQELNKEA